MRAGIGRRDRRVGHAIADRKGTAEMVEETRKGGPGAREEGNERRAEREQMVLLRERAARSPDGLTGTRTTGARGGAPARGGGRTTVLKTKRDTQTRTRPTCYYGDSDRLGLAGCNRYTLGREESFGGKCKQIVTGKRKLNAEDAGSGYQRCSCVAEMGAGILAPLRARNDGLSG